LGSQAGNQAGLADTGVGRSGDQTERGAQQGEGDGSDPGPSTPRRSMNTMPRPANPAADRAKTTGRKQSIAAAQIHPSRAGTRSRTSIPSPSPTLCAPDGPAVPDDAVPDDAVPDDAVPDDRATISDCDLGPDLGQKLDSDTTDLAQLLDRGEPAVCGAPVQDPL